MTTDRKSSPLFRFQCQRTRAKQRGIGWELTFDQWFGIWTDSGHWERRGRKAGCYCMARNGDKGPYAVGNVSIVTVEQNHSEGSRRKTGLPVGVYPDRGRFRALRRVHGKLLTLGSHDTPEAAHAAYLAAEAA